jgi:hypothetical protein
MRDVVHVCTEARAMEVPAHEHIRQQDEGGHEPPRMTRR